MGMFAPGRSETVNYHYWPIRFGWFSGPCQQTLWQWIRRAIDSRRWTLDYPHRYTCLSALEIHRAAARRMWHRLARRWQFKGVRLDAPLWTIQGVFRRPGHHTAIRNSTNGPYTPESEVG